MAYQSAFGWIKPKSLIAVTPSSPNHLVVFTNRPEEKVSNGPAPEIPVVLGNPLNMPLDTEEPSGIQLSNFAGTQLALNDTRLVQTPDVPLEIEVSDDAVLRIAEDGSLASVADVRGLGFTFETLAGATPLLTEAPSDFSLWLGPADEPTAANRILYLGENPVDTDANGLVAYEPATEHLALFKDDDGEFVYCGLGGSTLAKLDQPLEIDGYLKIGDDSGLAPSPATAGNALYADGSGTQARIAFGNYPVIRSRATPASVMGGSLIKNRVAVFANTTGDISMETTPDDETPDEVEPATFEDPVEIEHPDPQPDGPPALKVCQDSPTEPTTEQICNEDAGGTQIIMSHPASEGVAAPATIASIPPALGAAAGVVIGTGAGGAAAGVAVPVPAIVVPPIAGAVGIAMGLVADVPVAAVAAAAAFVGAAGAGGAPGAAAGAVAAAAALGAAAITPAAMVVIGGVLGAGAMTLVPPTSPMAMPLGTLSVTPGSGSSLPAGSNVLVNGDQPVMTWVDNGGGGGAFFKVPTAPDGKVPTSPDGKVLVSPSVVTVGDNPYTIGTADPGAPASIEVPTFQVGPGTTGPTTLILAGPCAKTAKLVWDCATATLSFVIVDPAGPTETTLISFTETTLISNLLQTFLGVDLDSITLALKASNPGSIPSQTIWLDTAAATRPKFGSQQLALLSDVASNNDFITFVDQGSNPGTSKTLWLPTAGLTRPKLGANSLALLSDIVAAGLPWLEFVDQAANPGTVTSKTLWLDTANLVRPKFGGVEMALVTDVVGTGGPLSTTLPVNNEFAVFGSNSTAPTALKTADGPVTCQQNIVANQGTASIGYIKVRPNADTAGGIALQSLPAPFLGYSHMIINGFNSGAGITRNTTSKGAWRVGADQTGGTDQFFIDLVTTTAFPVMQVNLSDRLIRATIGFFSTRFDVLGAAANAGGASSIWVDSGNSSTLSFGASKVLTVANPSTVNSIPVFSTVAGVTSTVATTTAALLARPLTITSGSATTAADISGTATDCTVIISTTNAGSNRGSVSMGKTGTRWLFGTDTLANGQDNFFISKFGSGVFAMTIAVADHIVVCINGVKSKRIEITPAASNPGGTNTLWTDSTVSDALSYGASKVLTVASPSTTNSIPVFNNTSAVMSTSATTTPATLVRPLGVSSTTSGIASFATTSLGCSMTLGSTHASSNQGKIIFGNANTWTLGSDFFNTNENKFFVSKGATTPMLTIDGADSLVWANTGLKSKRLDMVPVAANPGSTTTCWVDSTGDVLKYGADALMTSVSMFALMTQEWNGTMTIGASNTTPTSTNLSVTATKVGRNVTVYVPAFSLLTSNGSSIDTLKLTPTGGAFTTWEPAFDGGQSMMSGLWVQTEKTTSPVDWYSPTWKWDATNHQWYLVLGCRFKDWFGMADTSFDCYGGYFSYIAA